MIESKQTLEDIKLLIEKHGTKRFPHNIKIYWLFGLPVTIRWLNINVHDDCYAVWSSSCKKIDIAGDTFCVQFSKETGARYPNNQYLSGAFKSELSLWPVRDPEEAAALESSFRNRLHDCAELVRKQKP